MTRAVSVLSVAEPRLWEELEAHAEVGSHLGEVLDPCRRVVLPTFEREVLPRLQGLVLVRYARRPPAASGSWPRELVAARESAAPAPDGAWPGGLGARAGKVLASAQRHALDGVVNGIHAWDPEGDADLVRQLVSVGLLLPLPGEAPPAHGAYRLHPGLGPAPEPAYDLAEAAMALTDDLPPARPGPVALLHDLAAVAAAIRRVAPKRTHAGTLARSDARRLGRSLGVAEIAAGSSLEDHPRWGRALRALEALGAVSMDPIGRELGLDLGLDPMLDGDPATVVDRLVTRLLDRDLHPVMPALRAALRQAGAGAMDEVVFLDLIRDQDREVLFPRWWRENRHVYPAAAGERLQPWDDEGFERIEAPMIRRALARAEHLGLLRRAPGVFAPTDDGRVWAGAPSGPRPPVWVSSDLDVVVAPHAVTPWERFQLERLGRCLGRDVVDRYHLERAGLVDWLATHELEEALALLRRRCPAVPTTVVETLTEWARSAARVVLTRGVLLDDRAAGA